MKIFIFENVDKLTGNYHGGGGLVIVANNEEHAKEQISEDNEIEITDYEWENVQVYDLKEWAYLPKMFVFPDAGCC